jgi:hypothetical protein
VIQRIQRPVSVASSVPAPVGGWNARDSLAAMKPEDAVTLENLFPTTTNVVLRSGYSRHATGLPAQVESVMGYSGGTSDQLWAASDGKFYNVTASGAVGAAAVSGLTNSRWQHINITTAGGSYMLVVNGADKMRIYDGTNWHADGDGAPYDVTGVNTNTVIQINLHQNRVWLIVKNTLKPFYLATQSIGGAATAFDLSAVAKRGGYLMAMGTWTIDAGQGPNDYAAFITSNGEVIVYSGTNPASTTTWGLVGVWWLGSPVGRRCFVKYAGDLALICNDGVLPMSAALQSSRLNPRVALSDKIMFAVSQAITNYGGNFGWQVIPFPGQNMLILNVPISEGSNQQQYVMNTITQSWCNFTGWAANCWELLGDDLYFGSSTYVGKAWNTNADSGTDIVGNGIQAFNYFGSKSQKRFTMMRPTIYTDGASTVSAGINLDYDTSDTTTPVAFSPPSAGLWGTGLWGSAVWGSSLSVSLVWQGVRGVGFAAAPHFKASSNTNRVEWVSTDVVYERGGIL